MKQRTRVLGFLGWLLASALLMSAGDTRAQDPDVPFIRQVEILDGDPNVINVMLSEDVEGSAISWSFLSDPERFVLDIADASLGDPLDYINTTELVTEVAAEEMEDAAGSILRLSLTLSSPVEHDVQRQGSQITITLAATDTFEDPLLAAIEETENYESGVTALGRPLSGPELSAAAPPTVSTLDFENLDDMSRVIIGTNGYIDITTERPEPNLIVVDLAGASLAPSLERPLDVSNFISPVRMVRAYRTRSGTRVAVNLRRTSEYSVTRISENVIFLDIEIPESMKSELLLEAQSFTAAAPSTPETSGSEGLRSAYQQELLIGAKGRTVDPQSVFGRGSGAGDPSSLMGMAAGFMFDTYSSADLPYSGQRINIDLVNADIHSVFRLISHVSRLNIVAGDDVSGRVTVRLESVPWDQAFAAILQAKGLGSQRFGNIVRIAPIETIKSEQQSQLEAKRAADELEELQLYVVPLNYAQAKDISAQVETALSSRGSLEVDSRSNQLIIHDTEDNLAQVRELVRQLDRQTPQVLIEARIVEATSKFTKGLGIQWGGELDASSYTGYATGLYFPNSIGVQGGIEQGGMGMAHWFERGAENVAAELGSPVGTTSSIALNLGSISGLIDLDARLTAMEQEGWGKIVSTPRVIAMDNEEAYIKQGSRIPYLSTSAGGTKVQFVTAALELTVTPHITSDNRVFLQISVTNNRADFSQTIQGQPAIQIKEAETALLVGNGETKVIGGVCATERSWSQDRIPFLSRIPLLGYLFKNSGAVESRNEMLVFITPRILMQAMSSSN